MEEVIFPIVFITYLLGLISTITFIWLIINVNDIRKRSNVSCIYPQSINSTQYNNQICPNGS